MANFNELFDQWAGTYDSTVTDHGGEYKEVFQGYDLILDTICDKIAPRKTGITLEIGVGTGNLTKRLVERNYHVIGIEPSQEMRKIALKKLPTIDVLNGHFLCVPIKGPFDSIVTSYAFHHLELPDKKKAMAYLDQYLNPSGNIIIADTMFETKEYQENLIAEVEASKSFNLLNDLKTEYYEQINDLTQIFVDLNYSYELMQMNKYVWILIATKKPK